MVHSGLFAESSDLISAILLSLALCLLGKIGAGSLSRTVAGNQAYQCHSLHIKNSPGVMCGGGKQTQARKRDQSRE